MSLECGRCVTRTFICEHESMGSDSNFFFAAECVKHSVFLSLLSVGDL